MLFQITHTHGPERCPAIHGERGETLREVWRLLQTSAEVRVLSAYASPLDHVFFFMLEASDLSSVVRAMAPLNAIGTAHTTPVMPLGDLLELVDEDRDRLPNR
jgi:hypothetical protein